jgi:hypothetical protein
MAYGASLVKHVKVVRFAQRREIAHCCPKAAHLAPTAHVQYPRQAFFQAVDHNPARAVRAPAWHSAYQVVKLTLNGGQVIKDVSVVKLQIVEYGCAGAVVHELASFVKKCGVVFVRFNDKYWAAGWQRTLLRVPRPLCGLLLDLRKIRCHPTAQAR